MCECFQDVLESSPSSGCVEACVCLRCFFLVVQLFALEGDAQNVCGDAVSSSLPPSMATPKGESKTCPAFAT